MGKEGLVYQNEQKWWHFKKEARDRGDQIAKKKGQSLCTNIEKCPNARERIKEGSRFQRGKRGGENKKIFLQKGRPGQQLQKKKKNPRSKKGHKWKK